MTFQFQNTFRIRDETPLSIQQMNESMLHLKEGVDFSLDGGAAIVVNIPQSADNRYISFEMGDGRTLGPVMLPAGPVRWMFAWTAGVAYDVGDVVTHQGSSYACAAPHTAAATLIEDIDAARWQQLAAGGSTGHRPMGMYSETTAYQQFDSVKVLGDGNVLRTYVAQEDVAAGVAPPNSPWGLYAGDLDLETRNRLNSAETRLSATEVVAKNAQSWALNANLQLETVEENEAVFNERLNDHRDRIAELREDIDNIEAPSEFSWAVIVDDERGPLDGWAAIREGVEEGLRDDVDYLLAELGNPGDGDAEPELPTGGTTGQVLAKASGADGDVVWVNQASGGGGESGPIAADDHTVGGQALSERFEYFEGQIVRLDGVIATMQSTIDTQTNALSTQASAIEALQALVGRMSAVETKLNDNLEPNLEAQILRIDEHQTRIAALEGNP